MNLSTDGIESRWIQLGDQIPLFTYGSVNGFVSGDWTVLESDPLIWLSGAQVLDDGLGTIYLTGVYLRIPEPGTALLLVGAAGLAVLRRRRRTA